MTLTRDLIKKHEGCVLTPYKDTKGVLTIGYGYNLAEGISQATAEYLLDEEIDTATMDCWALFDNFHTLNEVRKAVLINMAYNMGRTRLSSFKKMIAAIKDSAFEKAAAEMLDSKWANIDVGKRAIELASLMRNGQE